MKINNFNIDVIVEHGYPHYKVIDLYTGIEVHCDMNELNATLDELHGILHDSNIK